MVRQYSLAVHDLKISGGAGTIDKIKTVLHDFRAPLTLHLIFDEPLQEGSALFDFLKKHIETGALEVVFHGLTHACPKQVGGWLSFYHKYQAEYLNDSDALRNDSAKMFHDTVKKVGQNIGVCPPCWMAHKNNLFFFDSLKPLYIEALLHISFDKRKIFSPVISLGSSNKKELFFLKLLGKLVFFLSLVLRQARIRLVIHACDLDIQDSLRFFLKCITTLEKRNIKPVLLKDLK